MVKNVDYCFTKPKMTSSNVFHGPQLKDTQFTVIETRKYSHFRSWNQRILTLSGRVSMFNNTEEIQNRGKKTPETSGPYNFTTLNVTPKS